jgi:hypothetical protein
VALTASSVFLHQNNLGWCHENGLGVDKSVVESAKWYRRAAIQVCAWSPARL